MVDLARTARHEHYMAGSTRTPRPVKIALLLSDAAGLVLASCVAIYAVDGQPWPDRWLSVGFFALLVLMLGAQYIFNLYNPLAIVAGLTAPVRALLAVFLAGLVHAAIAYNGGFPSGDPFLSRSVAGLTLAVYAMWVATSRVGVEFALSKRQSEAQWLVVSDSHILPHLKTDLTATPFSHVSILLPGEDADRDIALGKGVTTGQWQDIPKFLDMAWSGIILATRRPLPEPIVESIVSASQGGIRVYDLVDFCQRQWGKVPAYYVNTQDVLRSQGYAVLHDSMGRRAKRLFDIATALTLLCITFPLMLATATCILLETGSPVLFRQIRVGKRGREFTLYKFRSMAADAEAEGPRWASASDPRVTKVGRVMRLLRIDELPQLYNILRGEMSFIGPRPERPEFTSTLADAIPGYELRHLIKPGLTGWAQVLYPYGATVKDAREKLSYDLYYVMYYSLLLDFAILLKTIRIVLLGRGR